jgi:hypothetical protein
LSNHRISWQNQCRVSKFKSGESKASNDLLQQAAAVALNDAPRCLYSTSTLLVFFSLIEVLVTTILDNNQQTERAKKIDRYCRAIFPIIFAIASVAIFMRPRD